MQPNKLNDLEEFNLYIGHFVLISILAAILIFVHLFQRKRKILFPISCISISLFFIYATIQYYFDVFHNTMQDGFELTWSTYLLAQNEDFLFRNSRCFGLYWGIGIVTVAFVLAILSFFNKRKLSKTITFDELS